MDIDGLKPETQARLSIDEQLKLAGWKVQTWPAANLGEGLGVAIREYPTDSGPANYILFVNRKAIGVIEAKKMTVFYRKLKIKLCVMPPAKLSFKIIKNHCHFCLKPLAKLFSLPTFEILPLDLGKSSIFLSQKPFKTE